MSYKVYRALIQPFTYIPHIAKQIPLEEVVSDEIVVKDAIDQHRGSPNRQNHTFLLYELVELVRHCRLPLRRLISVLVEKRTRNQRSSLDSLVSMKCGQTELVSHTDERGTSLTIED